MSETVKGCLVIVTRYSFIDTMGYKRKFGVNKVARVVLERNFFADKKAAALQYDFPLACEHEMTLFAGRKELMCQSESDDEESAVGVRLTVENPGFHAYAHRWRDYERFHDEEDRLEMKRKKKT